jgi:hypothetical protein
MDWLAWIFGNSPLRHGPSMVAFVVITLAITWGLSLPSRGRWAWGAAIVAIVAADLVFSVSWVVYHGVHSTIGIATFLLLFVGAAVALPAATVISALRDRKPGASASSG